jgi:hypothetical protein
MNPGVSKALHALGALLLLGLAYTGIAGGIQQYSESHTTGQWVQTNLQLVFGIFSILAVIAAFRASRWRRAVNVGFVASTTLAGGLAPIVWGEQGVLPGLAAGIAAALVCWLIVWLVGPHNRATATSAPVS